MCARTGYKLTEVGEIPEDWDAIALGPHIRIGSGSSPSTLTFKEVGIPYFKVEQLNSSGNVLKDTPYFIDFSAPLSANSIVFPKRGASILLNKIKVSTEPFYFDTNIMSFSICNDFDHMYIFYQLQKTELWRVADTTSIPQINNKHILPLALAVPRKKTEQTAIAAALSDADAFIEALEQSIAKKRHIKQGAMQELLTGKKRLPGFGEKNQKYKLTEVGEIPEDWEVKPLSYFLHNAPCYGINAAAVPYDSSLPRYIRITDISDDGKFLTQNCVSVCHKDSLKYLLKKWDIVFARTGASVGKTFLHQNDDNDIVFAGFLIRISPNIEKIDPYFLWSHTKTAYYAKWIAEQSMRSGQPGVNGKQYSEFQIPFPLKNRTEQTAIAAVLSDMDEEITILEAKLAKARQIKAGMMQELLTGRIRLI